jgi:hypothetical protein
VSIPVLSGVGNLLDAYQRNVSDPVSGSILLALNKAKMGLGLGDPGSDMLAQFGNGMPSFGGTPTSDPSSALAFAFNPSSFGHQYDGQDNPLGRFAFQTLTDPLNAVGLGLPGKLAETGLAHTIPGAVGLLDKADWLDKVPGAVTGSALNAGKDFVWGGLQRPLSAIQPSLENFATHNPGLVSGWQDATRMWKAGQHMVPSFPVSTNLDDLSLLAARGEWGAAGDAAKALPSALKTGITGQGTTSMGLTSDLLAEMGGDVPHAVSDAGVPGAWKGMDPTDVSSNASVFSKYQTHGPTGQWDAYGNQVIGPTISSPGDWILNKLAGLDSWSKNLEQQGELAKRGSAYGRGYTDAVAPDVELAANKMEGYGYGDTAQELRDSQGIYSPSRLAAELRSQGASDAVLGDVIGDGSGRNGWQGAVQRAGGFGDTTVKTYADGSEHVVPLPTDLEPAAAQSVNRSLYRYRTNPIKDAADNWQAANPSLDLYGAGIKDGFNRVTGDDIRNAFPGQAGVDEAANDWDRSMMSAKAEDVVRSAAQNVFGGYKFAAQNVPNFVRLAGGHPILANAPAQYYRDSDLYNLAHGLPESFHGSMPMGTNPFNGDQLFMNPLGMSSMADLMQAASKPDSAGATGLGDLSHLAGEVGLGTNPLIKAGLQLTGQMGNDQMSDTFAPLQALSGVASLAAGRPINLEQPLHSAVATGEQALTGKETFPYQDYLIRKRTGELSPSGNQWNATMTGTPANNQAVEDVGHRVGASDLLQTLAPLDVQMLSPEAARVAANQRTAQLLALRGMTGPAAINPTGHIYDLADPLAEKVARFQTLPVLDQQALIRDPRALEMLQRLRSIQIHNPQALAAG